METYSSAELFEQLHSLYAELEQKLPKHHGNPCGTCNQCCTARGVTRQSLTDLELDYIAHKAGQELVLPFRAFAARERDSEGDFLFDLCPYYDLTIAGCGIHEHRPFACRTYGPYRLQGTRFPEDCVFIGHEQEIPRGKAFQEIPVAGAVRDLSRTYWPHVGARLIAHTNQANQGAADLAEVELNAIHASDPLDQALVALASGETMQALEKLANPGKEEHEAFRLHHLALVLMTLERQEEAKVVLQHCLSLAPESWELYYNIALNCFHLGEEQNAVRAFLKTVEFNPLHGIAWGFLAYLAISRRLFENAAQFLENAVALDPENATFRLRLAKVYLELGKIEGARTHLMASRDLKQPENIVQEAANLLSTLA